MNIWNASKYETNKHEPIKLWSLTWTTVSFSRTIDSPSTIASNFQHCNIIETNPRWVNPPCPCRHPSRRQLVVEKAAIWVWRAHDASNKNEIIWNKWNMNIWQTSKYATHKREQIKLCSLTRSPLHIPLDEVSSTALSLRESSTVSSSTLSLLSPLRNTTCRGESRNLGLESTWCLRQKWNNMKHVNHARMTTSICTK